MSGIIDPEVSPEAAVPPGATSAPVTRTHFENPKLVSIAVVIVVAIVATGLAEPNVVARLSIAKMLMGELKVDQTALASFFFLCPIPFYVKPLGGILSDAFPLLKTRRRHYLIASGLLGALSWIGFFFVPHQYVPLLTVCIVTNVFLALGSSVAGGLLVEAGRKFGATTKLTSIRAFTESAIAIVSGPLGGFLATGAFAMAIGLNAAMIVSLVPFAYFLIRERPVAPEESQAIRNVGNQMKDIGKSNSVWLLFVAFVFFYCAPGFWTPLFFRQVKEFELSMPSIGWLNSISSIGCLAGVCAYALAHRKLDLRTLLIIGLVTNALGNLFFLLYSKNFALDALIQFQSGFFYIACELTLLNFAAQASPVGCEAMGYTLMLSARNFASGGTDVVGSYMSDHHVPFWVLVGSNSLTTLCVLLVLPFLPKAMMTARDKLRSA